MYNYVYTWEHIIPVYTYMYMSQLVHVCSVHADMYCAQYSLLLVSFTARSPVFCAMFEHTMEESLKVSHHMCVCVCMWV